MRQVLMSMVRHNIRHGDAPSNAVKGKTQHIRYVYASSFAIKTKHMRHGDMSIDAVKGKT